MRIEIYKRGSGFLPYGDEAQKVHARMTQGELATVKVCRVRDLVSHRRYWALVTLCAANCECIKLDDGKVMPIRSKDDMHLALKFLTGHCDYIFDAVTGQPLLAIPKPTNFDEMSEDEWRDYWPKITEQVCAKVLPGCAPEIELEILQCARLAG